MKIIHLEKGPDETRVALEGSLDAQGTGEIETRFYANISHGQNALVDLSAVDFIASLGIRMLVTAARDLARRGTKLVLVRPQPLVARTLDDAALDQIIPWFESEADARLYLAGE